MKFSKSTALFSLALGLLLIAGANTYTSAQGRGGGRPSNPGPPVGMPGPDRGLGTASSRSDGRSDTGLGTASTRSNGRSDAGLDRARSGPDNRMIPDNNQLNRYRGISKKLGVSPETLRSQYSAALLANPDLKFGQFVSANVVAHNLNPRNPSITTAAILTGLQNGDSLGSTLKHLGVSGSDAKRLKKQADQEIKDSLEDQ